jgi:hypothetical protein
MSSTACGFSSDERSPGASPRYAERIRRRMTLALRVLGRSRTNSMAFGLSGLPSRSMTSVVSRVVSSLSGGCPGLKTTKQTSACPFISSGTPIAAASSTAGSSTSTDSTSAGPSLLPAILIVSSERPRMYQRPSSSIAAQSPCTQMSGNRDQYVCRYRSESFQKPRVMPIQGARTISSPTWLRTGRP